MRPESSPPGAGLELNVILGQQRISRHTVEMSEHETRVRHYSYTPIALMRMNIKATCFSTMEKSAWLCLSYHI